MATLNDHQKAFIVTRLACFDTLPEVIEAVKDEYGLELSKQQVHAYNPTKFMGKNLSAKWKLLFEETRKEFQANVSAIPLANQANRVRELEKLYYKASAMKNMALAAQLLEQLSKETGGAYTNKIKAEHTGPNGKPIEHTVTATIVLSGAPAILLPEPDKA